MDPFDSQPLFKLVISKSREAYQSNSELNLVPSDPEKVIRPTKGGAE